MPFELSFAHRFDRLSLDIDITGSSGVTALFGPSGSGKSTIIRVLAGLLRPDQGRARLGNVTLFDTQARDWIPPHARRMGCVFQDGRLFPHLSVLQNLRFSGQTRDEDGLIELLGLTTLLDRRPGTLSGGETQRVALARALLSRPDMLLMDEPLAALDGPRKDEILPYLDQLKAHTGVPILYVTHAVDEVARLADQVILLDEGKVLRHGSVFDVLSAPEAMPFLGVREAGSVLTATVAACDTDGVARLTSTAGPLELPGMRAAVGDEVRLRILAQDVILARDRPKGLSARNILPATIERIEQGRGPGVAVVLQVGAQKLLARITDLSRSEMGLEPGQPVFAILKATAIARPARGAG